MAREVVWTASAERDRKSILAYWAKKNGTPTYSRKLYSAFGSSIRLITIHPFIGRPTDIEDVRVKLVGVYNIFYRISADQLFIVRIIDGRRDLTKLKL